MDSDSEALAVLERIGVNSDACLRLKSEATRREQTFDEFFRWLIETTDALALAAANGSYPSARALEN